MLVTMLTIFTVSATSASMARFVVEDDSFGSADEIVKLKVLRNTQSGEKVEIVPDFPTGGLMDASEYNDGLRGGRVRVRAKIEVVKKSILRIVEIPWGTTTTSLQASIVAAQEKGKIK